MLDNKDAQHWQRFEALTTTQVLGASNELPIETFIEWIDDIAAENSRYLKKFLVFFQEGAGEERIKGFVDVVRTRLPDRELEVVENVPGPEIAKMIALANEINSE